MREERAILTVSNLNVVVDRESESHTAVHDLSLSVMRGQTLAVVGESGSGKTLLALSVMRLLPKDARITAGSIEFSGKSLLDLKEKEMRALRGSRIAMIFQDTGTSLDPLLPVGEQIGESIAMHHQLDRATCREQVLALMETVGIPDPLRRYRAYPHQLSGGIRQRVALAAALSCRPELLVADDPTSALDTTVQAQIVDLLSRLIRDLGMSVLLITHDLGVVASMADRVAVLYDGHVVEEGTSRQILLEPLHPYTRTLTAALMPNPTPPEHSRYSIMGFKSEDNTGQCPFVALCPHKTFLCREGIPPLAAFGDNRKVRCIGVEDPNG
jgi:peptide/nickel transport system ATP-binding protein